MESSQLENLQHDARTPPLETEGMSRNGVNGGATTEVVATPSQVTPHREQRDERRSSTGGERRSSIGGERKSSVVEQRSEEEHRNTTNEVVGEKTEICDDTEMKQLEEKEKRPREEVEETAEEKHEPKRLKVSTVEDGRGVCLEEIPNFVSNYSQIKPSSTSLRKLYKALFNAPGKPQSRRAEILQWKGISPDASVEDLFNALSTACTSTELAEIGKKYLGLPSGVGGKNTKHAWCEAVTEVLADPQPDKIQLAAGSDAIKRSSFKAGAGGYQAWCRDNREELKAKYPDLSHKEFLKIQSEAWKTISEEERGKYLGPPSSRKASPKRKGKPRKSIYEGDEEPEEMHEEMHEEDDEEGEVQQAQAEEDVTGH